MLARLAVHQCVRLSKLILFVRLLGEHRSGLGKIRRVPEKVAGQARLIGMRNTRTIKVGERVTISHGGRDLSRAWSPKTIRLLRSSTLTATPTSATRLRVSLVQTEG